MPSEQFLETFNGWFLVFLISSVFVSLGRGVHQAPPAAILEVIAIAILAA